MSSVIKTAPPITPVTVTGSPAAPAATSTVS